MRWSSASTFLLFPALGLMARAVAPGLLTPPLWAGLLMLCVLPSTVQSSIAFTSIARGNVPAALCAATASNLLGILLTPAAGRAAAERARRLLRARRGRHRGAASAAVRRRPACAAVDRRLGRPPQAPGQPGRSRLDPAGRLRRVQRGRDARHLAPARRRATLPHCCCSMRRCWRLVLLATTCGQPAARLRPRRRDHHRLLRLEEEPGERPADGERAVRRPVTRPRSCCR